MIPRSMFCHPEFGCDCDAEIAALNAEINMLRVRLRINQELDIRAMKSPHSACSGSTCTPECMRTTV